jgi:predicted metal-dependent hydrolase
VLAMLETSVMFPTVIRRFTNQLLKADGFSRWERFKLSLQGLWWTFKPGGMVAPMIGAYFTYYRLGFHPWQEADQRGYAEWLAAFNASRDPVNASEQMRVALGAVH